MEPFLFPPQYKNSNFDLYYKAYYFMLIYAVIPFN